MSKGDELGSVLGALADVIASRSAGGETDASYTAQLLTKGPNKIAKKLIEEAGELGLAFACETEREVANEAADVLYHMLVGLQARGVSLDDVAQVLAARQGLSGLDEKAGR